MNISGIYQIQSKIKPERIYIGSAINIDRRWYNHLFLLRKNKQPNLKLQNHFNKYGESDLQFSILLGCEIDKLLSAEQFYIDAYNPYFNICKKADSQLGLKRSVETKLKISNSKKGKPAWNKGKTGIYSKETLKKMGDWQRGTHHSAEHKRKIGEKSKGNHYRLGQKQSEESNKKRSESMKGKNTYKRSEETRNKMSLAKMGISLTEEHKKKIGYALKGKNIKKELFYDTL